MTAFEAPLLKEWTSHLVAVYKPGDASGRVFPFYNQVVAKSKSELSAENGSDKNHETLLPLCNPWTFGAAFAYAGSRGKLQ